MGQTEEILRNSMITLLTHTDQISINNVIGELERES